MTIVHCLTLERSLAAVTVFAALLATTAPAVQPECAGLEQRVRIADPMRELTACWDSAPTFALDGGSITTLAPGARVLLRADPLVGPTRVYEAIGTTEGGIEERYWSGPEQTALTLSDRRWLRGAILALLRDSGVAAKSRVEQLYAHGGAKAVRDEMAQIDSDHVRGRYLSEFLHHAVAPEDLVVIREIAEQIGSDHELRSALSIAFEPEASPAATRRVALQAAKGIGSDAEMRSLLTAAAGQSLDGPTLAVLLDAAGTIGSDFERRVVLTTVVEQDAIGTAELRRCLDLIADMGSDFEQRTALAAVAPFVRGDAGLKSRYLQIANRLGSFERSVALDALEGPARTGPTKL